jgi:hypothetical protein
LDLNSLTRILGCDHFSAGDHYSGRMTDVLHLGDEVEVVTDKFADLGAPLGSVGVIVDDWADGSNDVEISDPNTGEVVARVRAAASDIIPYETSVPIKEPREHGILFGRGDDLGAPAGGALSEPGSQFAGLNGAGARVWYGEEVPPEGKLEGDIPWELRDEPPSGPVLI